jgi:hypothetical protein
MKFDLIFSLSWKHDKIELRKTVDPEIVLPAKMNLCPSFSSSQLVSFDYG